MASFESQIFPKMREHKRLLFAIIEEIKADCRFVAHCEGCPFNTPEKCKMHIINDVLRGE